MPDKRGKPPHSATTTDLKQENDRLRKEVDALVASVESYVATIANLESRLSDLSNLGMENIALRQDVEKMRAYIRKHKPGPLPTLKSTKEPW